MLIENDFERKLQFVVARGGEIHAWSLHQIKKTNERFNRWVPNTELVHALRMFYFV